MNENEAASTRDWLTVSQVASRLKISERTVQRRCKNGRIAARLETREDGAAWLIDGATLPTGDATTADAADKVPTSADTSFESESEQSVATLPPNVPTLPTGADSESARVLAETEAAFLREALQAERENSQRDREQIAFLRAQVEAANRQAAESAAALREYLKLSAKQLSGGETGQIGTDNAGAQNGLEAPKSNAAANVSGAQKNAAQSAPRREARPLWKVILGLR